MKDIKRTKYMKLLIFVTLIFLASCGRITELSYDNGTVTATQPDGTVQTFQCATTVLDTTALTCYIKH